MNKARFSILALTLLLASFTAWTASAAQNTVASATSNEVRTMEETNKATVQLALAAWKSGNGSALQTLLSDDIEWTISGNSAAAGTTHGRQELMTKVLGPFGARFAQSSDKFKPHEIKGIYADGNTVIAHFVAGGTTNNGHPYQNTYLWMLTMQDGKVIRATAFFDSIAFNELWQQPAAPQ